MDKSAEGRLNSTGITMMVRKQLLQLRGQLLKIPLNLKLFYATGHCPLLLSNTVLLPSIQPFSEGIVSSVKESVQT